MGVFDWFRDAIETNQLIEESNQKISEQFASPHVVHDTKTKTNSASEFESWEVARKVADELNNAAGYRRYVPKPKQDQW